MPGLIHIYCGDGKGKTTAALGLALRCAGSGGRVLLAQFFKDGSSSEFAALEKVPEIETVPQTRTFGFSWTLSDQERREARAYYSGLLEDAFARSREFSLLVLDEAMSACTAGMIDAERLTALLAAKPPELEVVLTGRNPPQALVDLADYVTEMRKVKHPYERGVAARRGVEY